MNSDEYIFQFAPLDSEEWIDNPHSDYIKTTWLRDTKVGETVRCYNAKYRRGPRDPLLRAMVLAELEAK